MSPAVYNYDNPDSNATHHHNHMLGRHNVNNTEFGVATPYEAHHHQSLASPPSPMMLNSQSTTGQLDSCGIPPKPLSNRSLTRIQHRQLNENIMKW